MFVLTLRQNDADPEDTYVRRTDYMSGKIVQTAGRDQLGDFAPLFAHLNDDVLFGEVWNEEAIDLKR